MMFSPAKKSNAGATVAPILDPENKYVMPPEEALHEGTWLQWPHNYGWDPYHAERYDDIWIAMTKALHTGEKVHLIVFNSKEKERVQTLLQKHGVTQNVDFHMMETDDVWVRDNGPIFVRNQQENNKLLITDWRFNGWGGKEDYWWSNGIPDKIARSCHIPVHAIPMVLEGGSIEVDGRGTLLAKKSCIVNDNRNPGWTVQDCEAYFRRYFGVTNFIWLPGAKGKDVTDDHIDCTARFANGDTIVTTERYDCEIKKEYDILKQAKDVNGDRYKLVHLPLTKKKVRSVNDYGTYVNFYV
uniref:Agmatine deiminase n=1 Tax=Entomoneis paludosa TaxID=265537 RepID=A0A7S3DRM6_9STRA